MRKKSLLITATTAIIYLTISSYSGGPAHNMEGNKTGSPGSSSTCSGCHSGGGGTTTGAIEVRLKSAGASSTPVTSYVAGETYIITITGGNPTAGLDDFGFQFTALKKLGQYNHRHIQQLWRNDTWFPHCYAHYCRA